MFNFVMSLISAANFFVFAKGFADYLKNPDWRGATGCVISLTLAVWIAIKAIKEE